MRKRLLIGALLAVVAAFAVVQESGSAAPAPQKKSRKAQDATADERFSAPAAEALLGRLAQGLIRRNARHFLSAFDPARFADYALFAERVTAMLDQNDSFRAYYHITETGEQDAKGTATVEMEVEAKPPGSGSMPVRKRAQVRFECERGRQGWRIVGFAPPDFFTQL